VKRIFAGLIIIVFLTIFVGYGKISSKIVNTALDREIKKYLGTHFSAEVFSYDGTLVSKHKFSNITIRYDSAPIIKIDKLSIDTTGTTSEISIGKITKIANFPLPKLNRFNGKLAKNFHCKIEKIILNMKDISINTISNLSISGGKDIYVSGKIDNFPFTAQKKNRRVYFSIPKIKNILLTSKKISKYIKILNDKEISIDSIEEIGINGEFDISQITPKNINFTPTYKPKGPSPINFVPNPKKNIF
jgi:hypothetical protein